VIEQGHLPAECGGEVRERLGAAPGPHKVQGDRGDERLDERRAVLGTRQQVGVAGALGGGRQRAKSGVAAQTRRLVQPMPPAAA
jgi:hypothetical protein